MIYSTADYSYHAAQHGIRLTFPPQPEPEWVTPWDSVEITETELGGTIIEFHP